jgi:glycosyltransferase involved in cell wall biosynthesis
MRSTIHIWAPDLWLTRGGIQAYLLSVIQALRTLRPQAQIIVLSMRDVEIPPEARSMPGVEFHCTGGANGLATRIRFCFKAVVLCLRNRPDILMVGHVHFCSIAYFLRLFLRIPYYSFGYGLDIWGDRSWFFRHSLICSRKVITISNYTAGRIQSDQRTRADLIEILPCTFDSERFIPKPRPAYLAERYGVRSDQVIILMVCRLASAERYKGYDILIEAIPKLLPSFPNIRFFIAGKGADYQRVSDRIAAAGLSKTIQLLGFVPDNELCDLYNLCDVFAMPSKGEGFGIVFVEALACGKPVLAGNRDGSKDAVLQGEVGALVDPESQEEIVEALRRLLSGAHPNPHLRNGDYLRKRVIEAFGFPAFVRRLGTILDTPESHR